MCHALRMDTPFCKIVFCITPIFEVVIQELTFTIQYVLYGKIQKGKPFGTIQLFIQQKILFFYLAMIDDFPIISNIKQNMVKYKYFVDKKSKTRSIPPTGGNVSPLVPVIYRYLPFCRQQPYCPRMRYQQRRKAAAVVKWESIKCVSKAAYKLCIQLSPERFRKVHSHL